MADGVLPKRVAGSYLNVRDVGGNVGADLLRGSDGREAQPWEADAEDHDEVRTLSDRADVD